MTKIDIYSPLYQITAEYTLFSNVHITFTKKDCMLGYKTNNNEFNSAKVLSLFFKYNDIRLKINNSNIFQNQQILKKLNTILINSM